MIGWNFLLEYCVISFFFDLILKKFELIKIYIRKNKYLSGRNIKYIYRN